MDISDDSYNDDDNSIDICTTTTTTTTTESSSITDPVLLDMYRLRALCYDDLPVVKALHDEWFPIKYGDDFYNPLFKDASKDIKAGCPYSVAAVNNEDKIVGLLTAQCIKEWQCEDAGLLAYSFTEQEVVYITTLGVVNECRGQGIAGRLLEELITKCTIDCEAPSSPFLPLDYKPPHATRAIYLHVLTTNIPAIRFYEKSRFTRLREVPYYYEIDNESHDSFLYIYYLNNGHPPNLPNVFNFLQNKMSNLHQAVTSAWFEFSSVFCL